MEEILRWRDELRNRDPGQRAAAAENLCLAGNSAVNAAVELVRACGDEEPIREWAVGALEEMGPPRPEALNELLELTTTTDPLIAYWAVTLVGRLGRLAVNSQQRLAQVLDESADLAVREKSVWALGQIGALGARAEASLKRAAASGEPRLSRLALTVLEQQSRSPHG